MVGPPGVIVPLEVHGPCHRSNRAGLVSQERFRRYEISVPLEPARTRQRILVANRAFSFVTPRALLTRPRLRLLLDCNSVLFADAFETVDESTVRPEGVCLLVHTRRPVRRENVLDVSHVQRRNTRAVQPFHEVTDERILRVITSIVARAIQSVDARTRRALVFEERLVVCDTFRGFMERIEQVASFIQELVAGRRRAGDEIVRANVQSG